MGHAAPSGFRRLRSCRIPNHVRELPADSPLTQRVNEAPGPKRRRCKPAALAALVVCLALVTGCANGKAHNADVALSPSEVSTLTHEHPDLLEARGRSAYHSLDYERCAALFKFRGRRDGDSTSFYNAACCAAIAGNSTSAIELLAEYARSGGWMAEQVLADADLAPVRAHPEWERILAQVATNRQRTLSANNSDFALLMEQSKRDGVRAMSSTVRRARSQQRRARVYEVLTNEPPRTELDFFHASSALSRGGSTEDLRRSLALLDEGAALYPQSVALSKLASEVEDRLLVHEGKPQRWGTYVRLKDGRYSLGSVLNRTTDEQRRAQGLAPISAYEQIVEMRNANEALLGGDEAR